MNTGGHDFGQFHLVRIVLHLSLLLVLTLIDACTGHSSGDEPNNQAQKNDNFSLSLLSSSRGPFDAIVIQSTRKLNTATVNAATMSLKRSDNDSTVDINVAVNPSNNTITIQPRQALWLATAYTLSVTNISSVTGEQTGGVFTVITDSNIDVVPYQAAKAPTGPYNKIIIFSDDRIIRIVFFSGPGSDSMWGTDDDVVVQYEERIYQKSVRNTYFYHTDLSPGLLVSSKFVTGAGDDREWFNADDAAQYAITYAYDAQEIRVKTVYHAGAGADGVWLTGDDELLKYQQRDRVSDTEERETLYLAPGPDGLWFTFDDIPRYYNRMETDKQNHWMRYSTIVEPGVDATWFTDDDVPSSYTLDESALSDPLLGNISRQINYQDAGPDGIWFNADDTPSRYSVQNYTAELRSINYSGPGADNVWFTADDSIVNYSRQIDDGSVSRVIHYRDLTGNGMSADDEVYRYFYRASNIAGHRSVSATFESAGEDGLWFTADDVLYTYRVDDVGADGAQISIDYDDKSLGPDHLWLTDDDQPISYSVWNYNVSSAPYYIEYAGPGSDGKWFTSDDFVTRYRRQESISAADGSIERDITYADLWDGSGADGIWMNSDDIPSAYSKREMISTVGVVLDAKDITAGPDGIWFNDDDTPRRYTRFGVTINGIEVDLVEYIGPGVDGVWYTTDDEISTYRLMKSNVTDSFTGRVDYSSPGPDGIWVTADDIPESYTKNNFLINDINVNWAWFIGPGLDGIWFNTDDDVERYYIYDFISPGGDVSFNNPGPDGVWFTLDDIPNDYSRHIDALGNLTDLYVSYYAAGPDAVWFTDDDTIRQYNGRMLLGDGKSYRFVYFQSAGADGIWLTEDDVPSQYTQYNYDSSGFYLSSVTYFAPGPDNVWFTDDDLHY